MVSWKGSKMHRRPRHPYQPHERYLSPSRIVRPSSSTIRGTQSLQDRRYTQLHRAVPLPPS